MILKYLSKPVFILTSISLLFSLLWVTFANAQTVVRSGDSVSIAEDQTIEGDFYSAANIVNVSGVVEEDMISAGAQITINGSVGDDVMLFAGRTDIHGTIGDDLRIVSGEVTIAEPVMGDLFVVGGVVNILSTASIAGDILVYAGQVTIEGSVGGDIMGNVERLRIDGVVSGDVDVTVEELTLGDRADVAGTVRYVSHNLATLSQNANIAGGDLVKNDPIMPGGDMKAKAMILPVMSLLFSVLVWYLVSRRTLTRVVDRSLTKSLRPLLLGLAVLMFTPLAIGVLIVSMIGTLIGFVVLFGYLFVVLLSTVGLSAVLGQLLMKVFNQPTADLSLISLLVGVVGVGLLLLLPVVGQLLLVIMALVTLGAMIDLMIRPVKK